MSPAPLRGLCWDHPRSFLPLEASGTLADVQWERRSLDRFNEEPIEDVLDDFDLIVIDHPFVGLAAEQGLLIAIDELLDPEIISLARNESIGRGYDSYTAMGRLWAIDVDAACHVSLRARNRLHEVDTPQTWTDVVAFARQKPGRVGVPLAPADALCVLLSLGSLLGDPMTADGVGAIDEAFELLRELASVAHPDSLTWNSPTVLERLRRGGDIDYVPLLFGYAIASKIDENLAFEEAPFSGGDGGPLLGGSGVAVTARGASHPAAPGYIAALATTSVQREVLAVAGGQPPSLGVWNDTELDRHVGGFFSHTRKSLESAFVRPREPWWPHYQLSASRTVHAALAGGRSGGELHRDLEALMDSEISI